MKKIFLPFLFLGILGISAFWRHHSTADSEIRIIPSYQQINTVKELLKPYKGQIVYMDVWATWCGPCRVEMGYAPDLKEHIKGKDVAVIYLSVDDQEDTSVWKMLIHKLGLQGDHLLATKDLFKDLNKLMGTKEIRSIPRYILFDKKGKVIEYEANRPSSKEELYKQIDAALK